MFNFIFYSKKNLFLVLGLVALILLLFFIRLFSPSEPKPSPSVNPFLYPNPSTQQPLNNLPQGTPPANIPSGAYRTESLEKDFQRIISHKAISPSDESVRQSLITKLNNQSGILEATNDYKIEYVKAANSFMVELNSINPEGAKIEVGNWFKQQGLSVQGVCNLPVVFYLSQGTKDYLRQVGSSFNPIPEGCE